jgi:hypothetical protein
LDLGHEAMPSGEIDMSGYPQPPYGGPPQFPPGQYPPGQYPPGAYPPGYPPPGMMMPPPRTSAAAVISLVLGILFCIPGIASLGAMLFGIVGIRATSSPQVRGRGIAITGLIFGLLGVLFWGACAAGGGYYWNTYYKPAGPERALAITFAQDMVGGKPADAAALCEPGVDRKLLETSSAANSSFGPISQTLAFPAFFTRSADGSGTIELSVVVMGANNSKKKMTVQVADHADGTRKVSGWTFLP